MLINNIKIYPIGFGAMPLSLEGRPTLKKAIETIHTFIDLGGNLIDTADVYGIDEADSGHNERLVYKALQGKDKNNLIIATKGGATRPNGGWSFIGGGHPYHIKQACESSLRNLKINQHSLYYLHGIDPGVPLEESLGAIIDLKEEGKIQHIGIANIDMKQLHTACKLTSITAVQNRLNLYCKGDLYNGVVDYCKSNNICYIPYCPLGGWSEHAKLAKSDLFKTITQKYGISSYVVSLAWILSKGKHIIPIPGADCSNHVRENLSSIRQLIDSDDLSQLDQSPDIYYPKHIEPVD